MCRKKRLGTNGKTYLETIDFPAHVSRIKVKSRSKDNHFSAQEISYIGSVYSGILTQSVENLKQLEMVITSLVTQMSDGSRLAIIDGAGARIDQNYSDLHQFTQQNILLSMQRSTDANDLSEVKELYGLQ